MAMVLDPSCTPSLVLPANLLRGHSVFCFRSLIEMLNRAVTRTDVYVIPLVLGLQIEYNPLTTAFQLSKQVFTHLLVHPFRP